MRRADNRDDQQAARPGGGVGTGGTLIGYMRVSNADGRQTLDLQWDALFAAARHQPERPVGVSPSSGR